MGTTCCTLLPRVLGGMGVQRAHQRCSASQYSHSIYSRRRYNSLRPHCNRWAAHTVRNFLFAPHHLGFFVFFFNFLFIIYLLFLFLAVLGLRFCARAFSSCGKRGPLFIAVRGPFTVAASLVVGHRLQTCRLSSCGSRAQLLRGMWDLPGTTGLEPVSPALAGRFSTTAPPGKPIIWVFNLLS